MPVTTLQSTANGSDTAWSFIGGASRWQSVLPPDDADSTYVLPTANSRIGFAMQDLDAAAKGIQTHGLTKRTKRVAGTTTTVDVYVLLSGTYVDGADTAPGAGYADVTDTDLARPGGGPWTPADINAAEAGLRARNYDDEVRVTTLTWAVTWQPDTGNFASFAASLLGLVGGGLLLRHMPLVAAAISSASLRRSSRGLPGPHVRVLESEHLALWRELRCHPYRRFVWV